MRFDNKQHSNNQNNTILCNNITLHLLLALLVQKVITFNTFKSWKITSYTFS